MPTIASTLSSPGSSQGSSSKRVVSTSNTSTTSEKKRKVDSSLIAEPAVAQKRIVATLLNPLSATSLEPNEPWFTSLDVLARTEARSESPDGMLKKVGPLGSNHPSDELRPVTPKPQALSQQQKPRIEYREAFKVLQKLDVLSIATSKLQVMIEDIEKTTEDIDAIMDSEAMSFPVVTTQLRKDCQELVRCYEERLVILTRWSGETCRNGEIEGSAECMV
ncbi:hypothetical protein ACHAP5_006930 [Fusarium lateritium]